MSPAAYILRDINPPSCRDLGAMAAGWNRIAKATKIEKLFLEDLLDLTKSDSSAEGCGRIRRMWCPHFPAVALLNRLSAGSEAHVMLFFCSRLCQVENAVHESRTRTANTHSTF
jgi:hypothetical protein